MNPPSEPQDSPGKAAAEGGQVVLEGPAGIVVTLTPAAAEETAIRLLNAARLAKEQRGAEKDAGGEG